MIRRRDRGAALVVAMVAIIAIAGMATALINMASLRSKGSDDRLDQTQAFQAAQAAVEQAKARVFLLAEYNAAGDTSAGFTPVSLESASFGTPFLSDGRLAGSGDVGSVGGDERTSGTLTVTLTDDYGDPYRVTIDLNTTDTTHRLSDDSARGVDIHYFADVRQVDPTTDATLYRVTGAARLVAGRDILSGDVLDKDVLAEGVLEVIIRQPPPPDVPWDWNGPGGGSTSPLAIAGDVSAMDLQATGTGGVSGMDQSGTQHGLGLGMDGAGTFAQVQALIQAGLVDPSFFTGTPLATFDYDGTPTDGAIGMMETVLFDHEVMKTYADGIIDTVTTDLVDLARANGNYVEGRNERTSTDETWGTTADPIVKVVDANKLTVDHAITGAGTLVVMGDLDIKSGSLAWDGDVIVLGHNKNAGIHNVGGTVNINGGVVVIADENFADFHANGSGVSTTVNGAMLMVGGNATSGGGRARFQVNTNGANMSIYGMVMAMGDNIDFRANANTTLDVDGGIALAVPPSASPSVQVRLQGNVDIDYDSVAVEKASGILGDILEEQGPDDPPKLPPPPPSIVVWRER
ncbi:MAG: autotransporter outer membrane beta-barrel domain-containing protein [Planctomycetota bacterium]|jgi:hypothetical protein